MRTTQGLADACLPAIFKCMRNIYGAYADNIGYIQILELKTPISHTFQKIKIAIITLLLAHIIDLGSIRGGCFYFSTTQFQWSGYSIEDARGGAQDKTSIIARLIYLVSFYARCEATLLKNGNREAILPFEEELICIFSSLLFVS